MCLYCCCTVSDLVLYVIAVFLPPVAVLFRSGLCSSDLLLNILLTMLGVIPGMIHAFYYISVTSPMRRDEECAFYYQQGWTDSERQASRSNRRSHNPQLPSSEGYGSIQAPPVHAQPQCQNLAAPVESGKTPLSNAPPPYTELP